MSLSVQGLDALLFGSGPGRSGGVSLVSEGAEAVLISRKFFLQHLSDNLTKKLKLTVRPLFNSLNLNGWSRRSYKVSHISGKFVLPLHFCSFGVSFFHF